MAQGGDEGQAGQHQVAEGQTDDGDTEQVRQELSRQIDDELNKLNALIDSRVPAINEMIKGKGIEMIMIKKGPTDM